MKKKLALKCILLALLIGFTSAEVWASNVCLDLNILTLPITDNVDPTHRFREPGYETHIGTDWPLTKGSNVVAPHNAVVEVAEDNDTPNYSFESGIKSFGNHIKLDLGTINGHTVKIILGHLLHNSFLVSQGVSVVRGQALAKSGNSGTSTNYHLDMTVYVDEVAVDPYDRVNNGANWLWTTNPPTQGITQIHFSFPNHSSQDWHPGAHDTWTIPQDQKDLHTYMVAANGSDPGFDGPLMSYGYTTKQLSTLVFSARIDAGHGSLPPKQCWVYVRDEQGNWHGTTIQRTDNLSSYFAPRDYKYHEYAADLSKLGDIIITQISIQLTENTDVEEHWIFDWIQLRSGSSELLTAGSVNPNYDGLGGGSSEPTPTPVGSSGGNHPDPQQPGFPMDYRYTGTDAPVELQFSGNVPSAIVLKGVAQRSSAGNPLVQIALSSVAQKWFGIYEITQEQYAAFNSAYGWFYNIGENTPVRHVTLAEARAFCDWLNQSLHVSSYHARLPSPDEWVEAARYKMRTDTIRFIDDLNGWYSKYNTDPGLAIFQYHYNYWTTMDIYECFTTKMSTKTHPMSVNYREKLVNPFNLLKFQLGNVMELADNADGKRYSMGGSYRDDISGILPVLRSVAESDGRDEATGFRVMLETYTGPTPTPTVTPVPTSTPTVTPTSAIPPTSTPTVTPTPQPPLRKGDELALVRGVVTNGEFDGSSAAWLNATSSGDPWLFYVSPKVSRETLPAGTYRVFVRVNASRSGKMSILLHRQGAAISAIKKVVAQTGVTTHSVEFFLSQEDRDYTLAFLLGDAYSSRGMGNVVVDRWTLTYLGP